MPDFLGVRHTSYPGNRALLHPPGRPETSTRWLQTGPHHGAAARIRCRAGEAFGSDEVLKRKVHNLLLGLTDQRVRK